MPHPGETRFGHEITPAEFVRPGAVAIPTEPVVSDLKGRGVGEINISEFQFCVRRDTLADLGRKIPTAAPVMEQPGDSEVVGIVIGPCKIDRASVPPDHDGIRPDQGVRFSHFIELQLQFGIGRQCRRAHKEVRPSARHCR
ncbi:MAG: hypothetical protein H8E24_01100 [Verrucomicrobia bacterium]|nr:hypothetical protein [Verrucomicrobiota bacterium]